jgi:hypothetical protein
MVTMRKPDPNEKTTSNAVLIADAVISLQMRLTHCGCSFLIATAIEVLWKI